MTFYHLGLKAIEESQEQNRVTWGRIKLALEKEYVALTEMKFLEPSDGQESVCEKLDALNEQIVAAFQELESEM